MSGGDYKVDKIVSHRYSATGEVKYLVKWLGFPLKENTWESDGTFDPERCVRAYWDCIHAGNSPDTNSDAHTTLDASSACEVQPPLPEVQPPPRRRGLTIPIFDDAPKPCSVLLPPPPEPIPVMKMTLSESSSRDESMDDTSTQVKVKRRGRAHVPEIMGAARDERNDLVFLVKVNDAVHVFSNQYVKRHHARALVSFYERHILLGTTVPVNIENASIEA